MAMNYGPQQGAPYPVQAQGPMPPQKKKGMSTGCIVAIVVVLVGILVYIAMRFQLKFGAAAEPPPNTAIAFYIPSAVLGTWALDEGAWAPGGAASWRSFCCRAGWWGWWARR